MQPRPTVILSASREGSADGTMPLKDYTTLFGAGLFREWLAPDYLLRIPQLASEWLSCLVKLGKTSPLLAARRYRAVAPPQRKEVEHEASVIEGMD